VNPSPLIPDFTSLYQYPYTQQLQLCSGSANINFNVDAPVSGTDYKWQLRTGNAAGILIKDTTGPNTVISFINPGTYRIDAIAFNTANGGCTDTVSQSVVVDARGGFEERKIFLKQPGNLLIYPDNSLSAYQWGYDSVISLSPSPIFGSPAALPNQVYQFLTPTPNFLSGNQLDTSKYLYSVLLEDTAGCQSRVYYNGPYAARSGRIIATENPVELLVFPNPNQGSFQIALKGNIYGNINAKIYNALGQQVFTQKFVKMAPEIYEKFNTNKLSNGIYFLELYSSDLKKVVTRFIIQH